MAARRVQLRDDAYVGAGVVRLDGRTHACAARPYDEHVMRRVHA